MSNIEKVYQLLDSESESKVQEGLQLWSELDKAAHDKFVGEWQAWVDLFRVSLCWYLAKHGRFVINCAGKELTELPALPSALQTLCCNNNKLTALPTLPDTLQMLWCENNRLTDQQIQILCGKICPYCKSESQLVFADSSKHYKYVGWFRVCRPCRAWVGCHRNTQNALGRLANKELRVLKMEAHAAFDPIWKDGYMKRKEAYKWLSKQLDIPEQYTHIGMFGAETCKIVARISRFKYSQLKTNQA